MPALTRPACLLLILLATFPARAERVDPGDTFIAEARQADQTGDFEKGVDAWRAAVAAYRDSKDTDKQIEAQLGLAADYHALGQIKRALPVLDEARVLAKNTENKARLPAIEGELGAAEMLTYASEDAELNLKASLAGAKKLGQPKVAGKAANNLGVLYTYQRQFEPARSHYLQAIELAETAQDPRLALKAELNLARLDLKQDNFADAQKQADAAVAHAVAMPGSRDKSYALINAAGTFSEIFRRNPHGENKLRLKAFETLQIAILSAQASHDPVAESYALGAQGALYEEEKRYGEALRLTRRAAFLAQQGKSPDALYRWDWQAGRLLRAQGRPEQAMASLRSAVAVLEGIRHDVSLHYGNPVTNSSFREVAGDLYYQLADLILQTADAEPDAAKQQVILVEARDVVERLKSAELEDYFQDSCVNLLKSKITKIETVSATAAIVYIIPLPDRTELLVSLKSGLKRIKSPVGAAELTATAHAFRVNLEDRTTDRYLEQSWKLHDWIIKPIEPALAGQKIDTLVFVPDGALRNIPMAALNDGKKFLIQKYAVAVTPGLTLMEPQALVHQQINLIVNGLSEGVQGYPALPFVPDEIGKLHQMYGGSELLNKDFVYAKMEQEMTKEPYSIVHIASHGHFDNDAKKTYVLTFDSKMTLDQMERLLKPSQLRNQPIELLTLSACQTAAGDDRAALGLAGVAIKAGARSAFATLWYINDQASASLVSDFYTQLSHDKAMTKAAALQKAQEKLLADVRYEHPCYWAPYLIIGNWL